MELLALAMALQLQWEELPRPCKAHLRGLDVVNDAVIWASGTQGTVIRSIDSGHSWKVTSVPGADSLDFRDIEAFDAQHAIVMSSGNGVKMFRTSDGGDHWTLVYADPRKEVFFDGFAFTGEAGWAYGDPIDGRWPFLNTTDGGQTWHKTRIGPLPQALDHEAGFAASGTGITAKGSNVWIATGGGCVARVFGSDDHGQNWFVSETPVRSGEATGIFSICFWDHNHGVIVGGNYIDSTLTDSNAAFTVDGGHTWHLLTGHTPTGYRSCVAGNDQYLIAVGNSGTDVSTDQGRTWQTLNKQGFFSCATGTHFAWATGRNGKLGRLALGELKKD